MQPQSNRPHRYGPIPRPILTRIQARSITNEFECSLWTGATVHGYGVIGSDRANRTVFIHRFMYAHVNGPIPDGLFVCHRCDVNYPPPDLTYRRCSNPEHLFLGTPNDNMQDMIRKGRARHAGPKGMAHHRAKLTDDDVRAIRVRAANGEPRATLALEYGVTVVMIGNIVRHSSWQHIA